MADLFEKTLLAGLGLFDLTKEKAEKIVNELIKRGTLPVGQGESSQGDAQRARGKNQKAQGEDRPAGRQSGREGEGHHRSGACGVEQEDREAFQGTGEIRREAREKAIGKL